MWRIKKGSTRIAFVFNKIVIKIPNVKEYRLFLHGILSNLQEKQWSKINRNDLAKVYYCGIFGLILIMQKANVVSSDVNWLDFKEMLEFKYKNDDLKDFMISDTKPSNWGYISKRLVKIDYGD